MKAILNDPKLYNTIKMALFIATNVKAVKHSEIWYRMNTMLNWLESYDDDDDFVLRSYFPDKEDD